MSRPTWKQCVFGLGQKDLACLRLTRQEAIAVARREAQAQGFHPTVEAQAFPGVAKGRYQWLLQFPGIRKGPAVLVTLDDESGRVERVWARKR